MGGAIGAVSPRVILRIGDGPFLLHRAFERFEEASRSAEAFAAAGYEVAMISATGRFLMAYEPRRRDRIAI